MDIDENKNDEAVPALPWLTRCGEARAWQGHDWDAGWRGRPAPGVMSMVSGGVSPHSSRR